MSRKIFTRYMADYIKSLSQKGRRIKQKSIESDVGNNLRPTHFLIETLKQIPAPHTQFGAQCGHRYLYKERLVADKFIGGISRYHRSYNLIPSRQQPTLEQWGLKTISAEKKLEHVVQLLDIFSKHDAPPSR